MAKKQILISENAFNRLIEKRSKSIITEDYAWWGDTADLEQIAQLAAKIAEEHKDEDEDDFDPERRATYDLVAWATKVAEEAQDFIRYNAHNTPINGGENW